MKRFQIFIDGELLDKIRQEMKSMGLVTVSSFIRHALVKFFER